MSSCKTFPRTGGIERDHARLNYSRYSKQALSYIRQVCKADIRCIFLILFHFLQSCIDESQDPSLRLQLSLADIHLAEGNVGQACNVLRTLGAESYRPAIVSYTCVSYLVSYLSDLPC